MPRTRKPLPRHFDPPKLCGGKRPYASKREAEAVKDEQELMTHDLELDIYKCQAGCGAWHLTSVKK